MRKIGAIITIINPLIGLIGILSVGLSEITPAIVIYLIPTAGLVFFGIKGLINDKTPMYGNAALIIILLMGMLGILIVFQFVLGLIGASLLIIYKKVINDEEDRAHLRKEK